MTYTLGLSAYYHDSAAAIVRDGIVIAAAQEERFTRRKHERRFPANSVNYCLEEAFIESSELDAVVFYEDPATKLHRVLDSAVAGPNLGPPRTILGEEVWFDAVIAKQLGLEVPCYVTEHHLAHAASAYYPSPFGRAAVLTLDGVGEWATGTIGHGRGPRIDILRETRFPHSLGLFYAAATAFCGFTINSDEYKVMGLASYGSPRFEDVLRSSFVELLPDGAVRLNQDFLDTTDGVGIVEAKFAEILEGPSRTKGGDVTPREADIAASVQAILEEAVIRSARYAKALTSERVLVAAGGVFLNAVANERLVQSGIFDEVWFQPAAGDAGGALGAALLGAHLLQGVSRSEERAPSDYQRGSRLGPAYSRPEVRAAIDRSSFSFSEPGELEFAGEVARDLDAGRVVGVFDGRMEFGPRALGGRSILADGRRPEMMDRLNRDIKRREEFRPFAPVILAEMASRYFVLEDTSPYMLRVVEAYEHTKSLAPSVVHIDGSARVQTVEPGDGALRDILEAFFQLTGCPILINTSFNLSDEPIVCNPEDALLTFVRGGLDVLAMGGVIVRNPMPCAQWDGDSIEVEPPGLMSVDSGGLWDGVVAAWKDGDNNREKAVLAGFSARKSTGTLRRYRSSNLAGLFGVDELTVLPPARQADIADLCELLRVSEPIGPPAANVYPMF